MNFIGNEVEYRLLCELVQQFSPETKVFFGEESPGLDTITVQNRDKYLIVSDKKGMVHIEVYSNESGLMKNEFIKLALYNFLKSYYHKELDWGILTGVKPVKLFKKIVDAEQVPETVLEESWKVAPEKVDLLSNIYEIQKPYLEKYNQDGHLSLYIGIPMCFDKCTYCSFVTTVVKKNRTIIKDYLRNLIREIEETGKVLRQSDFQIDSIYIGGGTPSILLPEETDELLESIETSFDLSDLQEYTFEAGRPETTTPELLKILKKYGINRICLNPQTMNEETLKKINRNYSPEDILERFKLLREFEFNNINMDLICGLDDESEEDILRSLETLIRLDPEGITIHDLSIKKGSKLKEKDGLNVKDPYSKEFYNTIDSVLKKNGYFPYYMYRQKYTIGNGENIGYSKKNFESLYNILMMAEEQTILGLGAGSSGKLYNRDLDQFSKVFTVKDIHTYNTKIDNITQRKIDQYTKYFENI